MLRHATWVMVIAAAFVALLVPAPANASTWTWGTFDGPAAGVGERVIRVNVRVEEGLELDADTIAATVSEILGDERGWIASEGVTFKVVADDDPDLLVSVASPATTDAACLPLNTVGRLSCRSGDQLNLNVDRWLQGPDVYHASYDDNLDEYRRYLVNHEVGHFLGKGHVQPANCSSELRAPVMMQQTFGLNGCAINGWPSLDNTTALPPALAAHAGFIAAAVRAELRLSPGPWRLTGNPLRR